MHVETAILKEDYPLAQKLAQDLLRQPLDQATSDEAHYYLGLSYLRQKEYGQARDIFSKLTKKKTLSGTRDKAYLGIYDSYYIAGNYQGAYRIIKRLLKVSPRSEFLSLIYLKTARVNLKLAYWKDAKRYLKKITDHFPQSLEAHVAKQLLEEKQYFAVQVGAFMERDRAEKLVNELNSKNEYAYIVETLDRHNRKFYRVRVGQIAKLNAAQKLKSELSNQGYPTQIYP